MYTKVHQIDLNYIHESEKVTSGICFLNTQDKYLGTAILLRRNLQNMQVWHIKIQKEILQNRETHAQLTSNDILNIISVYCPADHYGKDYSNPYWETLEHRKIILAGDFNFVENVEDIFPKLNKNDKKIRKTFKPGNLNLTDPIYNTTMPFTCKNAILDRFYLSGYMIGHVKKNKILPEIDDHKFVMIELDLEELKLREKFYWEMNNHYLGDRIYKREVEKHFEQFEERK